MRTELKDGERIVLEIRKHWFVLVRPTLFLGLFFLITVFSYSYNVQVGNIFLVITFIIALYFVYRIFARKFDILVVTNLRVIDESGVFSHNAKESPLDKINNISYKQSLLGRILNYGDVQIQTAAEMGATINKFVTSPKLLKDTITKYQNEYNQVQIAEQAQKLARSIIDAQMPKGDTKECPYCGEIIKAKAKVCRFCGRELE